MKNVLCFVFLLTFALVLSHKNEQKRGGLFSRPAEKPEAKEVTVQSTTDALANLVTVGAPIILMKPDLVSLPCTLDMKAKIIPGDPKKGLQLDFGATTCYAIGKSNLAVHVISKIQESEFGEVPTGSEQCANTRAFQAVFLPFGENAETYTILNPDEAPWFFTTPLGGCDMFVAVAPNEGNRPIVIHSNRNNCKNNIVNLREKGNSVDQLLTNQLPKYKLIARWYYEPKPEEMMEADLYLKEYKANHKELEITLMSYSADPPKTAQTHHFIGHYNGRWNFILKGEKDGKTTTEFSL